MDILYCPMKMLLLLAFSIPKAYFSVLGKTLLAKTYFQAKLPLCKLTDYQHYPSNIVLLSLSVNKIIALSCHGIRDSR